MKTMITAMLNDSDREALARVMYKRKRPASRADVIQWMATLMEKNLAAVREQFRKYKLNPDANQAEFPWLTEPGGEDADRPSPQSVTP